MKQIQEALYNLNTLGYHKTSVKKELNSFYL